MNRNADRTRRWSVLVLLSLLPGCDDTLEFAGCGIGLMSFWGTADSTYGGVGSPVNSGSPYSTPYGTGLSEHIFPVGGTGPGLYITATEDPAAFAGIDGMYLAQGCPGDCWAGTYSGDLQTVRLIRADRRPFYAAPILFESPNREALIRSAGGGTLAFDGSAPVGFDAFQPREAWYGTWIQFEVPRDRYLYVEDMKVCWTAEHAP